MFPQHTPSDSIKKICFCGLPLFQSVKTSTGKVISFLGIPFYSRTISEAHTVRYRFLFIRWKKINHHERYQTLVRKIDERYQTLVGKTDERYQTLLGKNNERYYSLVDTINELLWAANLQSVTANPTWLKDKAFAPGRWALGYPALYALYRILNEAKPKRILELGLGQSTRMIGQYAVAFEGVEHTVVEHDPEWIDFFQKDFALSDRSRIVQLDKENVQYKDAKDVCAFACFADTFANQKFDFICVDAPFGSEGYSRIDVLKLLPDCLTEDFIILFDDTNRGGEMHTLEEIATVLKKAGIAHHLGHYAGDKMTSVICSASRKFFASM